MKSSFTCILALLLSTAAGCGGSDAEPLRIVATAPAAGATGVAFRAPVVVTFDAPVELAGIPADGWMVEGPAGPVAGSLESKGTVVQFTPTQAWAGATQYRVRLASGVTATDGRRLGSPVTWTFGTPYPSFAYEAMGPATFVYRIDPDSGRLEPRGQQILQGDPRLLAVHPGGHRAYASSPSGDVTAYEVDSTSGWLHAMGEPVATAVVPRRLLVDPQGRWLFVLSLTNRLVLRVALDAEDGSLASDISSVSITYPMEMAVHPTEPFLFVLGATVDSYRLADAGIEGPISSGTWTFDPLGRLTTTPDGGHVLTGSSDAVIQTWTVDAATGVLTALPSTAAAPASPRWPAMHPTGEWLFTVERSLGTITPYALDARTGTLGSPEPPAIVPANPPVAVAVDPSGRYLYQQGNTTVGAYAVDSSTGALAPVPGAQQRALSTAGLVLGASRSQAVPRSERWLYVVSPESDALEVFEFDAAGGGVLTRRSAVAISGSPADVTASADGRFVYATRSAPDGVVSWRVDRTTGELSLIGLPLDLGATPAALCADGGGRHLFVARQGGPEIWRVPTDASTGELAAPTGSFDAESISPVPYSMQADMSLAVLGPETGRLDVLQNWPGAGSFGVVLARAELGGPAGPMASGGTSRRQYVALSTPPRVALLGPTASSAGSYGAELSTAVELGAPVVALALTPDDRFLLVACESESAIHVVALDPVTGSPLGTQASFPVAESPTQLLVDGGGSFVHVLSKGSRRLATYRLDPAAGAVADNLASLSLGHEPVKVISVLGDR